MVKPPWLDFATKLIGEREIKGRLHNPAIVRMWERMRIGVTDDETPWCAAFVGYCLESTGFPSTRSGLALSYEKYGIACPPAVGSIAYMKRYNSSGKLIGGHVTFPVGLGPNDTVMCLGGNQGDSVSVALFPKSRILGYRTPASYVVREPLPSYFGSKVQLSQNEA